LSAPGATAAVLFLAAVLLAACASPVHMVDRPSGPLPWSAAIGRLDSVEAGGSCSATLVRPDVILTASHCLYGRGDYARITDFSFTPALDVGRERLRPIPVTSVIAMGWPITPDASGELRGEPRDDWALLRIARHVDYLAPLKVEKLSVAEIEERLKAGNTLAHAGYGVYGVGSGRRLQIRDHCRLIVDEKDILGTGRDVIKNNCAVIPGDSGGPILLSDAEGQHVVVGVMTNFWRPDGSEEMTSFGPSSVYFADKIGEGLPTPASATSLSLP